MVSTLNDLTLALSEGRTSSVALTELALARAQDAAGEGARVFTKLYAESALAQARASDTLRAAGIVRSAVEGLPISIKDLFDIEGETTMAGSVAREGEPAAEENAEVVQRLIAAGAVIIGRTNMTEFAYSGLGINPHYGTPLNPYDRSTGRIPGGSSSGAAVSVADGMAVAGIGSDTGGSVRIPAALCGLTGFKPSAWRVSMTGVLPLSANLDSIGPIAASVRCCAELDAILSGDGGPVPEAMSLRGLRLAVPTTLALDAMDKHVADTFAATIAKLKDAGALVDEIAIPEFAELGSINSKGGFTAAEAWAWHRDLIARAGKRYDPRVVSRIMRGQDMSAADYLDLLDAREAWVAAVDHRIAGYDALIMPTTPIVAPAVADLVASDEAYYAANGLILRNPTLINFLDGCALSLPCQAAGTAPVGLMISGSNGADRRILAVGLAVEALLAGH
ncbi:amidase [Achromobacter piechaudii]|uniref:2-amino-5-chloromuconic acid deaminase n=1 Tax=Achromobacter piechaudii TaxID=72556 RepID=A0A6S7D019_9BURK|nr:amidase [Achromobacter piechaudii]CAB3872771.1 2-amino-5-chloromuconic acid deaminase [Achromobacter piechaudii]